MGNGTGALNYEQALAETDRLLGKVAAADDLLSQYRAYLQERSARAAAFLARLMA
jgi:exodeoxyribonuclease-1